MEKNHIAAQVVNIMIDYFGNDIRRINHALKVYAYSQTIGQLEMLNTEEMLTLELSAILHDIGIKESERKYNSSAGNYQEIEGPPIASVLLNDIKLSHHIKERILYIIGNHHTLNKIDGKDFQILVEADALVNIDEDGIEKKGIISIREKVFKTKTGINFLETMFF